MDLKSLFPISVELHEDSLRLDQFLSQRFPDISRSRWKALAEGGLFRIDGKTLKNSAKLKASQRLEIDVQAASELLADKTVWEIRKYTGSIPETVSENQRYLVINKPSGVPVHPGAGVDPAETLVAWLLQSEKLSQVDPNARVAWGESVLEDQRPGIVHRRSNADERSFGHRQRSRNSPNLGQTV